MAQLVDAINDNVCGQTQRDASLDHRALSAMALSNQIFTTMVADFDPAVTKANQSTLPENMSAFAKHDPRTRERTYEASINCPTKEVSLKYGSHGELRSVEDHPR
jgi:hypothetical protein